MTDVKNEGYIMRKNDTKAMLHKNMPKDSDALRYLLFGRTDRVTVGRTGATQNARRYFMAGS